jgi:hypothetical protein
VPRGGKRVGAGRPKKPLAEKIMEGNPGKRKLEVLSFPESSEIAEFPSPPQYLKDASRADGNWPGASEIYEKVSAWLETTGCLQLISPDHITEYSLLKARWLECEAMNAKHGLLAKHPVSGQPIASPYVRMGIDYLKAADSAWSKIWSVVSENSKKDYRWNNPNEDVMEALLSKRP